MQETRDIATGLHETELFEAPTHDQCVAKMNDALIKDRGKQLIKRTFFKDKKSARKAQKAARRRNRKCRK